MKEEEKFREARQFEYQKTERSGEIESYNTSYNAFKMSGFLYWDEVAERLENSGVPKDVVRAARNDFECDRLAAAARDGQIFDIPGFDGGSPYG